MSYMSEPSRLQFVDTNILVYAHDTSAGAKHMCARELIRDLWESGEGCLSIQVLQEFYVNVTRKVASPLSPSAASMIIADLSQWAVHCPSPTDVLNAIDLHSRHQISFWDAMIVASAVRMGCGVLWSEDLNKGQAYDRIEVQSPF
jgi:predicted nucleic acid-binding protein